MEIYFVLNTIMMCQKIYVYFYGLVCKASKQNLPIPSSEYELNPVNSQA